MSKNWLKVYLPAVLVMMVSVGEVAPADAAEVCLSPKAREALAACAKGTVRQSAGKKPAPPFVNAPQGFAAQPKAPLPAPSAGSGAKQMRRSLASVRAVRLLITYIQTLESLRASTSRSAPDRPAILRRLAEAYVELESSALQNQTLAGVRAESANGKDPKAAQAARGEAARAGKTVVAARKAAIKYYAQLKTQYPNWCQSHNIADPPKSTGCSDEVLYFLAYEHEQASQPEEARKVYFELIQRHPASQYIPNAYLAFGELFFNEAQGDPAKWQLAEQSYKEVVKYPPPKNTMYGYARYKLAFVHWKQGELAPAMSEFKKTIEYGMQRPHLANATYLAEASRRDILPVYALGGDPKKAYAFMRPLAGDAGASDVETFRMLDALGQSYLDIGRYKEGIELYEDLMAKDRGPSTCKYQTRITEATLAMQSGKKDLINAELDRQLDALAVFAAAGHPEKVTLRCANDTAALLTETAMVWHLEAAGTVRVRGTRDRKTMRLSAELYKKVIATFQEGDFARFAFPRIVKEDWPTAAKIKYAMADILYAQEDWAGCGPAFEQVVTSDPTGPMAAEAAYAGAVCFQKKYLAAHTGGRDRTSAGCQSRPAERCRGE